MDYREFRAKTVNEAITKACLEFSVVSSMLEYTVVQEPSSGFLGIGARPCILKARPKAEEQPVEIPKVEAPKPVAPPKAPEAPKAAAPKAPELPKEEPKAPEVEEVKATVSANAPTEGDSRYVTMDEIELRAARAAARAKQNGEDTANVSEGNEREERYGRNRREGRDRYENRGQKGRDAGRKNFDRKDNFRGGRGQNGRYGRDSRYDRPGIGVYVEEKPHAPSVPKPERVVKPRTEEEVAKITAAAEKFLKDVFEAMHCDVTMTMSYDQTEGCLSVNFSGDDMGILIGKRGQTLDSLQYLTSLIVNKEVDDYVRVKLDTEDYRARRADTLENLSRNIAYKVKQSGRAIALEPMNPYERRIIHSALQHNRFVETYSEGEEPYRHVVVAPRKS